MPGRGLLRLDYQVTVEVLHFEGWLGGESRLLALWSILDGAELPLWSQRASLNAPVGGREYEAMVMAMNQLLEWLSRDLAMRHPAPGLAGRGSRVKGSA